MELFQKIMQNAPPGTDLALLLAQAGVVSTSPPIVGLQEQGTHGGEPAGCKPRRAGQTEAVPNSTVTAGLSIRDADVSKANSDVVECDSRDEVSRSEKITDSTLGSEGMENPTKEAVENAEPTSTEREVVQLAEEGERAKQTSPIDKAARARAATVHIYRRRPAREEASVEQTTENRKRGTLEARTERGDEGPADSYVEPPCCRRRHLIVDQPEEEGEEVVFALIEDLPKSGQPDTRDGDRGRSERKRKGKPIAAPAKKKPRQASSTLVIRENRQMIEEVDDEEEEALRRER